MGRVFANAPGDLGSIPGRCHCLTFGNIRYVSRVERSYPWKGVAPSFTPWCSSYRKASLLVTLDYGGQRYFYFIMLYIYIMSTFRLSFHIWTRVADSISLDDNRYSKQNITTVTRAESYIDLTELANFQCNHFLSLVWPEDRYKSALSKIDSRWMVAA